MADSDQDSALDSPQVSSEVEPREVICLATLKRKREFRETQSDAWRILNAFTLAMVTRLYTHTHAVPKPACTCACRQASKYCQQINRPGFFSRKRLFDFWSHDMKSTRSTLPLYTNLVRTRTLQFFAHSFS